MILQPSKDSPPPFRPGIDAALRSWLRLPRRLRALAPLLVMGALWWSSSCELPQREPSLLRSLAHNGMHGVAYAALAGLLLLASGVTANRPPGVRWASAWSLCLAIAYGIVDELHQSFVPGRVCSVVDGLSDAFGAASALTFLEARLQPCRFCATAFPICVVACVGSVVLATWGPW